MVGLPRFELGTFGAGWRLTRGVKLDVSDSFEVSLTDRVELAGIVERVNRTLPTVSHEQTGGQQIGSSGIPPFVGVGTVGVDPAGWCGETPVVLIVIQDGGDRRYLADMALPRLHNSDRDRTALVSTLPSEKPASIDHMEEPVLPVCGISEPQWLVPG